ncbi:choice-of-anchor I family protein [Demequina muriae]|uniref:Choice-of-anchor I family protein n=1 Tax=Demequina muriae TaxID=3051664 RepID=A0ABT8GIG7_9MICO|nr:choice-of-anchor I family protein [Demequina sp. EGI L300058]MDN4481226.1 choice-of-anchor I family protein [Demequina sp. EGI L300058]
MPLSTASSPRARLVASCAAAGATVALGAVLAVPATAAVIDEPLVATGDSTVTLTPIGSHDTGVFDESAAEIVAFHAGTQRLFTVDANAGDIRVLDVSDATAPVQLFTLSAAGLASADGSTIPAGAVANSVDVRSDGLVAVAVEAPHKTDDGWLAFFDADGAELGAVRAGALPDMVTITPNGKRAVVANEGEPSADYDVDPEGSISVVDLPKKLGAPSQQDVATADFHEFEDALPAGVRIFAGIDGADMPVSRGLEPEYATVDTKSRTAYVTLQENNAIAVVDLASATVTDILPLGAKDHSIEGSGMDASDEDGPSAYDDEGAISIGTVPVMGLYMPDAIASYSSRGRTYLVTANEGDAREFGDYEEPARIKDLGDDGIPPVCDGVLTEAQLEDSVLGRLDVSTASGLSDDGSCYETLYSFGARSFSIWSTDGKRVFDSGDDFETITAQVAPAHFNSDNDESTFDSRSDAKGPEPEAVTTGRIGSRTFAFVGLERVGGIMVYDITVPAKTTFVTYVNNRDFAADPESPEAGDLGPEGLAFIEAQDSPTGSPLLAVASEVSGTTTLFDIDVAPGGKGQGKGKGRR